MFIANHYVRVNGKMYLRGERIPDGLPAEKLKWLTDTGAVKETVSVSEPEAETPEILAEEPAEAEAEPEETAPEPEEDADEEAEAPEIDVMAGIVQEEAEAPEKPARRTGTKKPAERRKTK